MAMMNNYNLKKQLRQTGASGADLKQALSTAARLKNMPAPRPSSQRKAEILEALVPAGPGYKSWGFRRLSYPVFSLIVLMGGTAAAYAHSSLPGSHFYSVKKAGQNVRLWVQPDYAKQLVKDRQHDLNELKHQGEDESKIQQAQVEVQKAVDQARQSGVIEDNSGSGSGSNSGSGSGGDGGGDSSGHDGGGDSSGSGRHGGR